MNNILFFSALIILTSLFLLRRKITNYLYRKFEINIESEIIVYIVSVLFIAVILMGMLMDDTKAKYSSISNSFNSIQTQSSDKPHRWFDINFDVFK